MKMYELDAGGDSTKYCDPYINDDSPWYGEKLRAGVYEKNHDIPIIYTVENKNKPDDYEPTGSGILVSKKFLEVINVVCKNIEIFPSVMHYKGEKIFDEFYTIIFPAYEAFNHDESIFEWSEYIPNYLGSVDKIVLSKNKLKIIPAEDNIFHLEEKKVCLIVTEIAKDAMEKAGLVGVRFTELEVM